MQLCRTPTPPLHVPPLRRSRPSHCFQPPPNFFEHQSAAASLLLKPRSLPGIRCISSHDHGVIQQDEREVETVASGGSDVGSYEEAVEVPVVAAEVGEQLAEQSLWKQMTEIVKFAGPAAGIWICGPLMSLIDTAVVGQGSSTELAALGPTTVLSDSISYVFMFLSIAASNMVATSLAREIRGLAWPFILIGWVAQSASLGMKNSWGPLKALAVASAINGVGDVILCLFMDYGIAGAVWATMVSQHVFSVVAAYMMITALNGKGYNAFAVYAPSYDELVSIIGITAPAFITMISKVASFSLLTYAATSMGTILLPLTRS